MARKILLADDSVTAQNMGRKILADAGYEVLTVNNGSAALKKIAEGKPDLIILDVYMPGYSGLEVCQRLKEASETARIPILLTVGKLEPFKPEEAKRVRAEGYIVKPFEASELLSALSKLEDKIVPRAEASKPGRFARAIAAVEEGRRDPAVAVEEDSGWKNRIAFPSGKKKGTTPQETDVDDPAIYNPVNKDLRTTVESKPSPVSQEVKPENSRVDLGALAHQGLPKDVTPEEIAALAAAAAQIKGTMIESPASQATAAEIDPKTDGEYTVEEQVGAQPAAQLPAEVMASPAFEAIAEEPKKEADASAEARGEDRAEELPKAAGLTELSLADEVTPIDAQLAYMSREPGLREQEPASGNGSWGHATADEPVTMAAIAAGEFAGVRSRWIAVPVALLPEETGIFLEQEMQKTLAVAEAALAAPVAAFSGNQPAVVETFSSPETPVAEPLTPESVTPLPEVAQSMSAAASAAASVVPEAFSAVVKQFETVTASVSPVHPPFAPEPEPAVAEATESVAQAVSEVTSNEVPPVGEAKAEETPGNEAAAPVVEVAKEEVAKEMVVPEPVFADPVQEEPQAEAAPSAPAAGEEATKGIPQQPEIPAPDFVNEMLAQPISASQVSEIAEAPVPVESDAGGKKDTAENESETAAATAAAWASWRKIRESGDAKAKPSPEPPKTEAEEPHTPKDEAAMAVAAGAEKAPETAPVEADSNSAESDPAEIASIVDSVLADLRPQIVAEISRKLGKKK
ncbi:MAG TPA: response regulator [Candidatus Sulfotelmatobacter sp.]|nr:response regulator [Candidatus Sulfotelmatobacter sp.]